MIRRLFVCFCVLAATQASFAQDEGYEPGSIQWLLEFDFSKRLLTDKELRANPYEEHDLEYIAKVARGIVFGRHGRVFHDQGIAGWLNETEWYEPNPKFNNSMLNDTERKNLDLIRKWEAELHERVQPGDLRFWRGRLIPPAKLKGASGYDLHIMKSEIEAIHGKRFDDEPTLQKYFEERYWYKPSAGYKASMLDKFERENLRRIAAEEARGRGARYAPGTYLLYGDKRIPPSLLSKLSLYEIRLLRNEVFAVRGATFRTFWLQQHFGQQDWYSPLPEGKKAKLTRMDQLNLAAILKEEEQRHTELSSKRITAKQLDGLRSDDANKLKNEIYARRGKVFKTKWLQSYFASLAWYKPNPKYADSMLTPIERGNIATIAKYETKTREIESQAEG